MFARRNKLTLVFTSSDDGEHSIVGHWSVTSYYTGNAVQSVIVGTEMTADFGKSDRVTGQSDVTPTG